MGVCEGPPGRVPANPMKLLMSVVAALSIAVLVAPAGTAAVARNATPGTYSGKKTEITVDSTSHVLVMRLPVHAKCKGGRRPSNEGDYRPSGLGPFTVESDGSFTNVEPGTQPLPSQTVIKGKIVGTKASGTVVEPAFQDKGFDCARFKAKWTAHLKH